MRARAKICSDYYGSKRSNNDVSDIENENREKIYRKILIKKFQCSNIRLIFLILASVLNFQHSGCDESTNDFQKIIPTKIIWAIQNNDVEIPCDISPPIINDQVKLVLWFKDSDAIPMYSLDSRKGGSIKTATHSALTGAWTERIFFSVPNDLKDAKLHVRGFTKADAGVYRCRIDFFNSPTRNFRVNVTLIESPDIPRIFDAQGKEVLSVAGPYKEGHDLLLTCSVKGGNPNPKITWWHNGNEIKSSASHFSSETSEVVSQLFIENVTRDYYGSKFECRAQNSKLLSPVVKEILVQIHLKPLKVEIVTPNEILSTGRVAFIKCETWGSHPPAKVVWLLDGESIRQADIATISDASSSNVTTSMLSFKVLPENDGKELTCKSMNPWFLNGAIEDNRRISVSYPPRVWIYAENEDHKKSVMMVEKGNISLVCRSDARPKVTSHSWFKNGIRIAGENTNILHILSLEKEDNGEYSCSAMNTEGESMSPHLNLSIEFSPRCKPGTEQISVVAAFMHSVQIKCEVEADPSDLIKFHWTYNNTRNVSPVPNGRITMNGVVSTITHQVLSDTDEVTLACWATNRVGKQQRPCLTHIIPARVPETPRHCTLLQNVDYISVNCENGYDGGLPQNFILEVTSMSTPFGKLPKHEVFMIDNGISTMNDQATLAPILKIQEKVPQFKIPLHDLDDEVEYRFQVSAFNVKGQSDPFYILNHVKVYKNNSETENSFSENPISAETSNSNNDPKLRTVIQHSKSIILTAFAVSTIVMVAIISAACCVAIWCIKRTTLAKPDEEKEKNNEKIRSPRKAIPSMYGEEFDVECLRNFDEKYSPSSTFIGIRSPAEDFAAHAHYSKTHPNAHYESQH